MLRDARLDLAYFWEVGTDATNYFLPFCRIAPVQCTGWGWPVTSAAPELDYHLTSEPLAPPGTERFFCERLVRLPHLPAFMQKPPGVPWRPAPLASFGLPEARRLYLCTQNLRKVHPDMDFLVEGILRGDPGGIVAFVHDTSPLFGELLERRWQRTLGPYRDRLFLVPRQSPDRYTRLLASATVVLDTMYFGGANTAYDAYLARVPVVTLEGAEPRARYTSALHAQAGVEGLTARSPEEYVETAVRVATDPELRSEICERVAQGVERIFEPPEAVRQLETFFEQALGGRGL
ncbi:MAG: hypothetical protein KatS3mg076_1972 [Candidatus Binatia bacterium]|nr:MAG: hypothetical protein KatS3mg076_1972 [Candidatus Binatia bacterium]